MPNFSWDFYILVASNDATAVRQFYAEILKEPTCLHKMEFCHWYTAGCDYL